MLGDLPPSSSVSFFIVSAAVFMMRLPTSVEPVKLILSIPGCLTIASPAMEPLPGKNVEHARRQPRLERQLADADRGERRQLRRLDDDGVPAASAGAAFQPTMIIGKFHGMIAPTTPSGSRSV